MIYKSQTIYSIFWIWIDPVVSRNSEVPDSTLVMGKLYFLILIFKAFTFSLVFFLCIYLLDFLFFYLQLGLVQYFYNVILCVLSVFICLNIFELYRKCTTYLKVFFLTTQHRRSALDFSYLFFKRYIQIKQSMAR